MVAKFAISIATSERWKDRNSGEQQEKTEWHRVVVFDDRLVDVAEQYLQKERKFFLKVSCRPVNGQISRTRKIYN